MNVRLLRQHDSRRGAVAALTAIFLVFLTLLVGFAIDIGFLLNARTEMQRTADAAALAAAWEFMSNEAMAGNIVAVDSQARSKAASFAALNNVTRQSPALDSNSLNSLDGDIVLGYLSSLNGSASLITLDPASYNAAKVTVHRDTSRNGEIPFFFGKVVGIFGKPLQVTAKAALIRNVGGFTSPSGTENLGILPIALDLETWTALLAGAGTDLWKWNADTKTVSAGSDSVLEVNLYPQGTGSPGNRGTVDIGSSNNSTSDLSRQIVSGISPSDLEALGKPLELNSCGELELNGDTGISAGIKDELASIIGQTRIIPIFASVCGPGNNAEYTIVKFVGVRIMDVKLTGSMSSKRLIVQPALVKTRGVIQSSLSNTSYYIASPPVLVP